VTNPGSRPTGERVYPCQECVCSKLSEKDEGCQPWYHQTVPVRSWSTSRSLSRCFFCSCYALADQPGAASWHGVLHDEAGLPVGGAVVTLESGEQHRTETTDSAGRFAFTGLAPGTYSVAVRQGARVTSATRTLDVSTGADVENTLQLLAGGSTSARRPKRWQRGVSISGVQPSQDSR
jgi:hypothetical protein